MTNLAYTSAAAPARENATYVDFAARAARRDAQRRRQALCCQRRCGLALLMLCAVLLGVGLAGGADLTALLVLAPLGGYLLATRQVVWYSARR